MVAAKTFFLTGLISLCAAASLFARNKVCLNTNQPVYEDTVTHNNGRKGAQPTLHSKKNAEENNLQLNSWTIDVLGFFYSTVAQSYERLLKNKKTSIRIPLYFGYFGGSIPDAAAFPFSHGTLASNTRTSYAVVSKGFSVASGINPKFYLFKHKVVTGYIGPEASAGYSETFLDKNHVETTNPNCILSGLAKFGLSFNLFNQLAFGLDTGFGVAGAFGGQQSLGLVGVWHLGLAIGTKF